MSTSPQPVPHLPLRQHWSALLQTPEGGIFVAGLATLAGLLVWLLACAFTDPAKATAFIAVVPAHITGGRASGILIALQSGQFSRGETMVLATLIEGMVVAFFYSLFCLSCRRLLHVPWLTDAIRNVHDSARSHHGRLVRWGIPGLILFVWFPLMMTGPLVGSVIGHLIGLRPWANLATVMAGTVGAIVCWTLLMHEMVEVMERAGKVVPMLGVATLVLVLVGVRFFSFRASLRQGPGAPPPGPPSP